MSRIFSVNFNKSINDAHGNVANLGSTASVSNDEKGQALRCKSLATDYITYGDISAINAIGTGEFSFVVGANIKGFLNHGSSNNVLIGKTSTLGANGFSIVYQTNTGIQTYILNSMVSASTTILNKNNIFIVTRNSVGLFSLYINGISSGTPVIQAGNISTTALMSIGYDGASTARTPNASIYLSEVYNHCLSQLEIDNLVDQFKNQRIVSKPKIGFSMSKPTDLNRFKGTGTSQGLVAAYSMKPIGNTLVDISGNGNNATLVSGNTVKTKDGLIFPNSGYYKKTGFVGLNTGLNANAYSVSMRVKFNELGREQHLVDFPNIGVATQKYINATNRLYVQSSTSTLQGNTILKKDIWYTIHFLIKSPGVEIYIDAVSDISNSTYTESISALQLTLGYFQGESGPYKLNGEIQDIRIHNRVLTLREIKDYHNSFITPTLIEDFSSTSADNQTKVPQGWEKVSGSFKVNEIALRSGDLVNPLDLTTWTKVAGGSTATVNTFTTISNGGVNKTNIISVGKRYKAYIKGSTTAASFFVGDTMTGNQYSSTFPTGSFEQTFEFTVFQVTPILYLRNEGAGTTTINNFNLVEISPLKSIQNKTHYLECVTAGVIAFPSKQAFGTWEFDWYKGNDANTSDFIFINSNISTLANSSSSYAFKVDIVEHIVLSRAMVGSIIYSNLSYITNNTWYRIKITRTNAGVFTLLIKGGNFRPTAGYDGWTLISTSGGYGTNPVTDTTYSVSNYMVLDLDAGDRFSNLVMRPSIIV
jgi:hypothetical protein